MSAVKYFIDQNSRRLKVDEFLARELNSAGYGGVEIRKMPMRTEPKGKRSEGRMR